MACAVRDRHVARQEAPATSRRSPEPAVAKALLVGAAIIVNSIIWGNEAGGTNASGGALLFSWNCSKDGADAFGARHLRRSALPHAQRPAPPASRRLPGINAGSDEYADRNIPDAYGNARIPGCAGDLGAAERTTPATTLSLR